MILKVLQRRATTTRHLSTFFTSEEDGHRVVHKTKSHSFPLLSASELHEGCRLGFDSWADTCCAGKHAKVLEFLDGKSVTAHGFGNHLPKTPHLPIATVAYAHDTAEGETLILVVNNAIYMGDKMTDSLLCPNQCRLNGVEIDTRPSSLCSDTTAQSMTAEGHTFPLQHHGPLPYIHVRHPTSEEIASCQHIELTEKCEWRPYENTSSISAMQTLDLPSEIDPTCHIGAALTLHEVEDIMESNILIHDCDNRLVSALSSTAKNTLTPTQLARKWRTSLKIAKRTLASTTHRCIRTTGQLTRRFRTDKAHMRYRRMATGHGRFYVDTLFSKVKSIRGFTCGNLFTNKMGFRKFIPMEKEGQTPHSLQKFITVVGLPHAIHSDGAKVFRHGDFSKKCRQYDISQSFVEPYSPWQNRAEIGIKETKSYGRHLMRENQAPIRLWCFAYEYAADILTLQATGLFDLGGRTPFEHVLGYTPDISEYTTFSWYQWAYYWDELDKEKKLCRWLGVASNVGQAMCYWILIANGEYIARSTVIPIPEEDLAADVTKALMSKFTSSVHDVIGDHSTAIIHQGNLNDDTIYEELFVDDNPDDDGITYPWDVELSDIPLKDDNDVELEALDKYIGAHVVLPGRDGATTVLAEIKGRKRDSNGQLIGTSNPNPILDTRVYNLEFPDGHTEAYPTNIIAEALYNQVDDEGYNYSLFHDIVAHRKSKKAVPATAGTTSSGKPVITTKGWDLQVSWKDGTTDWIPLSQLKESNPIEVSEYAVAQNLQNEPAFKWWVPKVFRRRNRLINKVKTRARKLSMKFGLDVPNTVEEALAIDKKNGNDFWRKAIEKEMKNVGVAFEVLGDDDKLPPGYKQITCHLVFDVKFDLTRKARYVAGGHLTDTPSFLTYSSVVSRESVRIAFTLAALNDLDILAGDIGNAYLNAPTKEKVWFRAGPEFGARQGRRVRVIRALYGLKGSGRAWRDMLADTLRNKLGFKSSLADPDVWMKPSTKPNGQKYYEYILVYVDDLLIVSHKADEIMEDIKSSYLVKPDSIGPPSIYLGANILKIKSKIPGKECWASSAEQYVTEAVKNVKKRMKEDGFEFNKKLSDINYSPKQPFSSVSYRPELDCTAECTPPQHQYYQNLIGVLRWMVELGRLDIHYETAVLSQYLASPRVGHLQQALHIFKYLDIHRTSCIAFDPTRVDIAGESEDLPSSPENRSKLMKEFYPDAEDYLPPNAPEPRGHSVRINTFCDADHASNQQTRRSHTGIIHFLNSAPIAWFSKRQNSVETSTYSSEFVALKIATEQIIALHYKLRMFGVPLEGPARVFCDNEAVYKGAAIPDSTLKKKHNSIAYHKVRSSVACNILTVYKEGTESNLADLLTKSTHSPDRRKYLKAGIMVDIKINCDS